MVHALRIWEMTSSDSAAEESFRYVDISTVGIVKGESRAEAAVVIATDLNGVFTAPSTSRREHFANYKAHSKA